MFSNFVTFKEVVKLSTQVEYELTKINFSKYALIFIFEERNIHTATQIQNIIDDKKLIKNFYEILGYHCRCYDGPEWLDYTFSLKCNLPSVDESLLFGACKHGRLDIIKHCRLKLFNKNGRASTSSSKLYIS